MDKKCIKKYFYFCPRISSMKITLLSVGKTSFDYLDKGVSIYLDRLKHYLPVESKELPYPKLGKNADQKSVKKAEGELLLKEFQSSDFVVLLDENGKEMNSLDFSEFLQKRMNSGVKNCFFVIGGAYGFSEEVYFRADQKISLSKMTFSHQMVRLFALEQIYRGMTILKGEPYHHQ